MWRCGNVEMWRCGDVQMCRCEDEDVEIIALQIILL
jgi:hypothetical protein